MTSFFTFKGPFFGFNSFRSEEEFVQESRRNLTFLARGSDWARMDYLCNYTIGELDLLGNTKPTIITDCGNGSDSFSDSDGEYAMHIVEYTLDVEVGIYVGWCLTLVIAIIGVTGNCFAFLTASRLGSVSSGTMFIKCLAVSDSCSVVLDGFVASGSALFQYPLITINRYTCKFHFFFTIVTSLGANYVLSFLTLDRVAALWAPIAYKTHGKPKVAIVITVAIQLLSLCICAPAFTVYDLVNGECFMTQGWLFTEQQRDRYVYWLTGVGFIGAPFFIILSSNILIVFKLRSMKGSVSKREREITVSLVMVSVCFLVINVAIGAIMFSTAGMTVNTYRKYLLNKMLNIFMGVFSCFNNSINFFSYVLASSHFRTQFLSLFGKRESTGKQVSAISKKVPSQVIETAKL